LEDKELQEFYETRLDLLSHDGWNELVKDFENLRESVADINKCDDLSDLWFRRGQLAMIDYLINLKDATERAYEDV
jgi:hypothetical protein